MRNAKLVLVVILIVVLSLVGCGTSNDNTPGNNGNSNNPPIKETDYHKGTTALKLSFLPSSPPDVMYDGQPVPFSLEITNTGVADTTAYITLSGHDKNIIQMDWTNRRVGPIVGRSDNYPQGGYASIEEEGRVRLPAESESYPTTLKVTACYPYSTEAIIPVCVDPDPTNNKDDTCTPKPISVSGGQGAPVAVTKVETISVRGSASFRLTVQNQGKGYVLKTDKVLSCMSRLPQPDLDAIEVTEAKIGVNSLVCDPAIIRLVNNVGTTKCTGKVNSGSAYTSNLLLKLSYAYKDSITKPVSVRRI